MNRDATESAASSSAKMLPRIATMALTVTPMGLLIQIMYFFPPRLVRDAESLRYVLRTFQLVEHRGGVVLERDEALPLCVDKELVVGRAVLSGALARRDLRGLTQISPVQPLGLTPPN